MHGCKVQGLPDKKHLYAHFLQPLQHVGGREEFVRTQDGLEAQRQRHLLRGAL